ncbi:MAG TPA: hypothetical protein VMU84_14085 [Thermoanaerobaculia bacterium]|nr:hypothetical protein [Thermoanaerobaculia bacterium]
MAIPTIQPCAHHSERRAFALCMTCRKSLCQECVTQWDGIYHCASCLAARRSSAAGTSGAAAWLLVIGATGVLLYLSARAMVWAGALLASLF